jgi:hypothetical protein
MGAAPMPVGQNLPATPTLPLFRDERVVARYGEDLDGLSRTNRGNMVTVLAVLVAVFIPFMAVFAFTGAGTGFVLIFAFPLLLVLGVMYAGSRRGRSNRSVAFVTDRRIIVERYGAQAQSAAMGLETLGDVRVQQDSWSVRRAGVAWVYFLPMGTPNPIVGSGRYRSIAPGVLVLPASPRAEADSLRSLVLPMARQLQAEAYAAPTVPYPPPPP